METGRCPSVRDLIAASVLALLTEGPRHPYDMQRTIRERKFDFVTGLPRSLYHAVDRLTRSGLVEPVETTREGQRPERTVLRITTEGAGELRSWVGEWLSTPGCVDAFAAAISLSYVLPPKNLLQSLTFRAAALAGRVAELDAQLGKVRGTLPRMVLLAEEHRRTLHQAELDWVESLVGDLRGGALSWDSLTEEGSATTD